MLWLRLFRRWFLAPAIWTPIYLIAFYLFLPSWTISDLDKDALHTFQDPYLRTGSSSPSVTRVFHTQTFIGSKSLDNNYNISASSLSVYEHQYFILKIAVKEGQVVLQTPIAQESFSCPANSQDDLITDTRYVYVSIGDSDGLLWNTTPDAVLLYADMLSLAGSTYLAPIPLCVQCQYRTVIEQVNPTQVKEQDWDYSISLVSGLSQSSPATVLLTVGFQRDTSRVSWVHFNNDAKPENLHVGAPSITYSLRKVILKIVGPLLITIDQSHTTDNLEKKLPAGFIPNFIVLVLYCLVALAIFKLIITTKNMLQKWRNPQGQSLPFHSVKGLTAEEVLVP